MSALEARLTALEGRPIVSLDEVLARVDVLERAEYRIETGTSRELGHTHDVQATIVRVR